MFGLLSLVFGTLLMLVGTGQWLTSQISPLLTIVGAILWLGGVYVLISDYRRKRTFASHVKATYEQWNHAKTPHYPPLELLAHSGLYAQVMEAVKARNIEQSHTIMSLTTRYSKSLAPRSIFDRILGKPQELDAYLLAKKVYQDLTQATLETLDLHESKTYVTVVQSTVEDLEKGTYVLVREKTQWTLEAIPAHVRYLYDDIPPALVYDHALEQPVITISLSETTIIKQLKHQKHGKVISFKTMFFDETFDFKKPKLAKEDSQAVEVRLGAKEVFTLLVEDEFKL